MRNWITEEWRECWKWLQMQLGVVIAIAPELYQQGEALKDFIPQAWFNHGMAVLGLLVMVNSVRKKAAT